jgi:hypothetical protein
MVNYNTTYVPGSELEEVAPTPPTSESDEGTLSVARWTALAVGVLALLAAIYLMSQQSTTKRKSGRSTSRR